MRRIRPAVTRFSTPPWRRAATSTFGRAAMRGSVRVTFRAQRFARFGFCTQVTTRSSGESTAR